MNILIPKTYFLSIIFYEASFLLMIGIIACYHGDAIIMGMGCPRFPTFIYAVSDLMIKKSSRGIVAECKKGVWNYRNDSYVIFVIMLIKEFLMAMTTM